MSLAFYAIDLTHSAQLGETSAKLWDKIRWIRKNIMNNVMKTGLLHIIT